MCTAMALERCPWWWALRWVGVQVVQVFHACSGVATILYVHTLHAETLQMQSVLYYRHHHDLHLSLTLSPSPTHSWRRL